MDSSTERTDKPWRLGVLISGSGRTFQNILRVIEAGELNAEVVCVISSKAGVRGLDIATEHDIPAKAITWSEHRDLEAYSAANWAFLEECSPDLILMAGYLRKLSIPPRWRGRILNIHPVLLPQAAEYAAGKGKYGDRVHQAVLDHGDMVSGATVHVVTEEYDEGPPFAQVEVPVLPGDTVDKLAARVFEAECELYPQAIRDYTVAHPEFRR